MYLSKGCIRKWPLFPDIYRLKQFFRENSVHVGTLEMVFLLERRKNLSRSSVFFDVNSEHDKDVKFREASSKNVRYVFTYFWELRFVLLRST